ncbi:uncharacterized protein At1g51745-like [Lycium ferocissimum]|uniref:uncharacterized protein At1g51745-like n=1 Tax=Lycium ferocissimum TaxID=112874 RepID=UPI002815DFBA|nr:uncharacterized protein At1g51745-like [Lycium ferocissimum]
MGSSETEGGMLECDTGSIVWVRRRNGSWWPGKILGTNELSASHLMSPRSGTPVKLLGREDASVDWYNLEKSKRVKAFRCGEFDDCIKRAEASQGMPPKKREKYARREDAILHALELERLLLEKKYGAGFSSTVKSNKSTADFVGRESVTSSEYLENGNGRHIEPKSHQVSTRSGVCLEDKGALNILSAEVPKDRNQLRVDVDNSGVLPRMRGLQDIALSTAASEHNHSPSLALNGTDQPVLDSSAHAVHDGSNNIYGLVNFEKRSMSEKRKPSEDALVEDILVKRRDRRRPLAHVLQGSENLPVSLPQPDSVSVSTSDTGKELPRVELLTKNSRSRSLAVEPSNSLSVGESHRSQIEFPTLKAEDNNCSRPVGLCQQNGSGSAEYTETDSTESDSMESDTDDELATLSDGAASIELEPKYVGRSEALPEHGSMSSEEVDDFTLAEGTSHPYHQESVSAGFGVSKWKLKGKRNNRSLNKRFVDSFDGDLARRPHMSAFKETGGYACLQDDLVTRSRVQMAGYGSKAPGRASRNMFSWGDLAWDDQPSVRGYWEEASECFDPMNSYRHVGGRTMLVDVDLKVQSSYQREHVPMISLMSKLNGQAIVGHPIQVETLANGSTESFLGDIDDDYPETLDYDTSLQPTWRTARRTASVRVPRPHSSASDNPEGIKRVQGSDHHRNVRKATVGGIQKANTTRKITSRSPIEKTFSRKPGKRVSLSSNQKIRTLSSIASQQKQSSDSNSSLVDGALKAETLPTVVACIPVKLVFSRLNEDLVGRRQ